MFSVIFRNFAASNIFKFSRFESVDCYLSEILERRGGSPSHIHRETSTISASFFTRGGSRDSSGWLNIGYGEEEAFSQLYSSSRMNSLDIHIRTTYTRDVRRHYWGSSLDIGRTFLPLGNIHPVCSQIYFYKE